MTANRTPSWVTGKAIADSREDREAWLLAREPYLTGSAAAQAMGESKWKDDNPKTGKLGSTRERLLLSKTGQGDDWEQSEMMWWGLEMEDPILSRLGSCPKSSTYGWYVRPSGFLFEDADCPTLASTLDSWAIVPGYSVEIPLELKMSMFAWKPTKADPEGLPPIDYQIQCQSHCAVTGAPACALVQFCGNQVSWSGIFKRNEDVIDIIRAESVAFMKDVTDMRWELEQAKREEQADE